MTDYYELVGQVHEKLHEEQARRAQVLRNCFFANTWHRGRAIAKSGTEDRQQWMSKEGARDQWLEEIPF